MRRLAWMACVGVAAVGAGAAGSRASAATLCVGASGCFTTVQAAVDAAHDGDTIAIAPGTYQGGITVDVSVTLAGAGANRTTIAGGGPVVTIGVAQQFPPAEPTVAVRGVTIADGVATAGFLGDWDAVGGGIEIPPSCTTGPACASFDYGAGATVAISDSVITGNRAIPSGAIPLCGAPCAFSSGGGIANAGSLTVTNTIVTGNQSGGAGSPTLGASGGGIANNRPGTLTLTRSSVTGNRAIVAAPNGQFAQGGGIDTAAPATLEHSDVSDNTAIATGVGGESVASAGGIDVEFTGSLTLTQSTVERNRASATAPPGIAGFVLANAGGIGVDGVATITDSRIAGNGATAEAPDGLVVAAGGGVLADSAGGVTLRRTLVARNSIAVDGAAGSAIVQGGGITNFGLMTLEQSRVVANSGSGTASSGAVEGGGIWNSNFDGGPPTTPQLTLIDTEVTANTLTGSGMTVRGGGLFTTFPVTTTRTVIAGNKPDQCFGC